MKVYDLNNETANKLHNRQDNEDLKERIDLLQRDLDIAQQRYDALKTHAEEKLEQYVSQRICSSLFILKHHYVQRECRNFQSPCCI